MDSNSKKKNGFIYIIIIIVIIIIAVGIFFVVKANNSNNGNTQNNNDSANISRLATSSNDESNSDENNSVSNHSVDDVNNRIENVLSNPNIKGASSSEEELASYSTNLGSSTENRLTNIRITCGKLNETIVENGETFSFCDKTGPSTAEEGYKEATVFQNGKKVQALGGGNCQISSTLYNAVLDVSNLKVVERHEHGKKVSYVPDGKDAAVAYGSIDFKFTNNTGSRIKLYFSTDDKEVSVKIVKLFS